MNIFKKKCFYCGNKIKKGEEIFEKVKVPEFTGIRLRTFCSKEHAELYKNNIKETKRTNYCPHCGI